MMRRAFSSLIQRLSLCHYLNADSAEEMQALRLILKLVVVGDFRTSRIRGSDTYIPLVDLGRDDARETGAGTGFRQRFQG